MLKSILLTVLFQLLLLSSELNLNNKNIKIEIENQKIKTKKDYEEKNKYEKDPNLEKLDSIKKDEDGITLDGDVGIDKNNLDKPVDSVKVNMGTKF